MFNDARSGSKDALSIAMLISLMQPPDVRLFVVNYEE